MEYAATDLLVIQLALPPRDGLHLGLVLGVALPPEHLMLDGLVGGQVHLGLCWIAKIQQEILLLSQT